MTPPSTGPAAPQILDLSFAEEVAAQFIADFGPFADSIAVAGSVRRRRPKVGDIDLVAVPRLESMVDLFGEPTGCKNLLQHAVRQKAAALPGWHLEADGPYYQRLLIHAYQVDLWHTHPAHFGSVLLCRTGSKEHNIWLSMRAVRQRCRWEPTKGLHLSNGTLVGDTEESIYEALGLPYIPPEHRESSHLTRFDRHEP